MFMYICICICMNTPLCCNVVDDRDDPATKKSDIDNEEFEFDVSEDANMVFESNEGLHMKPCLHTHTHTHARTHTHTHTYTHFML